MPPGQPISFTQSLPAAIRLQVQSKAKDSEENPAPLTRSSLNFVQYNQRDALFDQSALM
jgi:hypothetical protein